MDEIEIYLAWRNQGLSHQEALSRAERGQRPSVQTTAPTPEPEEEEEGEGFLGATGEFAEGLGLGATRAVTSLGEGTGWLLQRGDLPGISSLGRGLEDVSERAEDIAENLFTPEGNPPIITVQRSESRYILRIVFSLSWPTFILPQYPKSIVLPVSNIRARGLSNLCIK